MTRDDTYTNAAALLDEVYGEGQWVIHIGVSWDAVYDILANMARERILAQLGDKLTWAEGEEVISSFAAGASSAIRRKFDPAYTG